MSLCGGKPSCDLLGVQDMSAAPEKVRAASCAGYIAEESALPPFLLIHGTEDSVVSAAHSRCLYADLKKAGKAAVLLEIPGEDHGGAWQWTECLLDEMMRFIRDEA